MDNSTTTKGFDLGEECIHGLDYGLCDACFPKAVPDVAVAVTPKPRVSRPRATSLTAPRKPAATGSLRTPPAPVADQRLYHVTHVSNLESILADGRLYADANAAWESRPTVDISSAETRESRRTIVVADENDASVASYVPFFLSPTASVWGSVRDRVADPRLSAAILESIPSDYVILVSSVQGVVDAKSTGDEPDEGAIVVTDGDAAHTLTRFATTREAGDRVLRKLRADEESVQILAAEYLVRDEVPIELISLIGVANDRARDTVKAIVKKSNFSTRVAVYPPWFIKAD